MMAGWTDDMMKHWSEAQKRYWDAWADMARMGNTPSSVPFADTAAPAWNQSLEQWWKAVSPYLSAGAPHDAFQRMTDMGKMYMSLAENAYKVQQTGASGQESMEAWLQGLEHSFRTYQEQLNAGQYPNVGFGIGQTALDNWQKVLQSIGLQNLSDVASSSFKMPSKESWQEHFNKLLSTPSLGLGRESQSRIQHLVQLGLNYQEAVDAYLKAFAKQGLSAVEVLRERVLELTATGKQIHSLRELYDLWVSVNDETYGQFALTDEYQVVYADMVNAMMALKSGINKELDAYYQSVNLPTRKELNTAYEKQQQLRRENRQLRNQLQALAQKVDMLATKE